MMFLVVAALVIIAYTYLGYPVLIALAARISPLKTRTDPEFTPRVSVLIPVYNAADYVAGKIDSLLDQDYPADKLEILMCSDASDDGSDELIRSYAERDDRIRLLRAERRAGKPNAVGLMRAAATGDVFLMTDIRQPLSKNALSALVRMLSDPSVGCVSGNLVLTGPSGAGAYWKYENWIRRSEARFRSMVGVTGPIYVVRRADMPELPTDIILDDMFVPVTLRLEGRRILLCEDARAFDDAFGDGREFGRKVRTLAGNFQLFALLPRLLIPLVNPSWFETFSHKILRLVCPFALLTLAAATIGGLASQPAAEPGQLILWLVGACQAAFYLGALVGPQGGRLTGLARTFVVLNAAAVVGLWRFVRSAQKVTW